MKSRVPPADVELRRQLARRASGRVPDDLLTSTLARLDAPRRRALPWSAPSVPRLALSGAGVALLLVLVAALALPSLNRSPATPLSGYPAERPLTTAELADVMAGPALPANTALVASVAIEARPDVCPTNRYQTIGVIEFAGSQICVMGDNVGSSAAATGLFEVFAFRYLAPGYLGMLGRVTSLVPGTTRFAFNVTDDWPLDGKAFLVEGWLGSTDFLCTHVEDSAELGDPLNPAGEEQCRQSWLSADGSVAPVRSFATWSPDSKPTPGPTADLLGLSGKYRYVQAQGAREFDSIPFETTWGVYVVRAVTGPCPGEPPYSSIGCAQWRVLARVPELSLPMTATPTPTTAATPASLAGYPADRPLTTAELAAILAGPEPAQGTALVAQVTIKRDMTACPMNSYPTVGTIEGMGSQICVMGAGVSDYLTEASATGLFAFRYLFAGHLGLLGKITPVSQSRLAFAASASWPEAGKTFLVEGWLTNFGRECPTALANQGSLLDPAITDSCSLDWIGDQPVRPQMYGQASLPPGHYVGATGAKEIDGITSLPAHGIFVARNEGSCPDDAVVIDPSTCPTVRILAALPDVVSGAKPTPNRSEPPATPQVPPTPVSLPTAPASAQPLGLAAAGPRPFTTAEFSSLWSADPAHLAGRIVLTKGPVPTAFLCWSAGAADASISPAPCHLGAEPSQLVGEGYWAVKVASDGKLAIVGQLSVPTTGGFAFTVDALVGDTPPPPGSLVLVDGWLVEHGVTCDRSLTPLPSGCEYSELSSINTDNSPATLSLGAGAYRAFTGTEPDWTTGGPPMHGLYLVQLQGSGKGTLLAVMATV
jgi:hypothetical protein